MRILGLTGSIAMGKSTAARMIARLGYRVHDADRGVHDLMRTDRRVRAALDARFPGVIRPDGVDRQELGRRVFGDTAALRDLEAIMHPAVGRMSKDFLAAAARARARLVVLDIPLLFETGGEFRCDMTVVVDAPIFLQRQRALARLGMTSAKLSGIIAKQMPPGQKKRLADHVINTGLGRGPALRQLRKVIGRSLSRKPGKRPIPAIVGKISRAVAKRSPTHAGNRPRYRNNRPRPHHR